MNKFPGALIPNLMILYEKICHSKYEKHIERGEDNPENVLYHDEPPPPEKPPPAWPEEPLNVPAPPRGILF